MMTFYHSRLADEPTDKVVSLKFLWFLSNVANSVEMKVLHKTTPISSTTICDPLPQNPEHVGNVTF